MYTTRRMGAVAESQWFNVLAQVKAACHGDWNKLTRCLRICGYLNATPEFADHPQVLAIHRLYAALEIRGALYRIKWTVKSFAAVVGQGETLENVDGPDA